MVEWYDGNLFWSTKVFKDFSRASITPHLRRIIRRFNSLDFVKSLWRCSESCVRVRKWNFDPIFSFRNGPKLQIWTVWKWTYNLAFEFFDHVSNCNFGPLSNCSSLQLWSILKRNKVDQSCICEVTSTHDSELLQTLWTKSKEIKTSCNSPEMRGDRSTRKIFKNFSGSKTSFHESQDRILIHIQKNGHIFIEFYIFF